MVYRLVLSLVLGLAGLLPGYTAFAGYGRPVVVELFTSQGCSSCPPADNILAELANDPNVLSLSYHVDYWNWLGWKDPFSHPDFTARQTSYNRIFTKGANYTPQIVINGKEDAIGSHRNVVYALIEEAKKNQTDIPFSVKKDDDQTISITLPATEMAEGEMTIWLIGYDGNKTTTIRAGENRGKTITYHNVVNYLTTIGHYHGNAMILHVPIKQAQNSEHIAVLLQQNTGHVMGAAICCE